MHPNGEDEIVAMGLVRTEKTAKKAGVLKADDNFRCAREIFQELHQLVQLYNPSILCFEAYSPVRHSSVAAQLGMVYGVLAALAGVTGLPVAAATPQAVKKACCGKNNASKDDVTLSCQRLYMPKEDSRHAIDAFLNKWERNVANHNHAWDSLGVMTACRDSEVMRALRHKV